MSGLIFSSFGNQANFFSTHLFNSLGSCFKRGDIETELGLEYLFASRLINNQTIVAPRQVVYDFDHFLGSFRVSGYLEQEHDISQLWKGRMETLQLEGQQKIEKNNFLDYLDHPEKYPEYVVQNAEEQGQKIYPNFNLKNRVDYWADYLGVDYFPDTTTVVPTWKYPVDPKTGEWGLFENGLDFARHETTTDTIEERLRLYAEPLDRVEGFISFVDLVTGWSGVCSKNEEILDLEFHKVPKFVFDVGSQSSGTAYGGLNRATFTSSITDLNTLIIPFLSNNFQMKHLVDQDNDKWTRTATPAALAASFLSSFRIGIANVHQDLMRQPKHHICNCVGTLCLGLERPFDDYHDSEMISQFVKKDDAFLTGNNEGLCSADLSYDTLDILGIDIVMQKWTTDRKKELLLRLRGSEYQFGTHVALSVMPLLPDSERVNRTQIEYALIRNATNTNQSIACVQNLSIPLSFPWIFEGHRNLSHCSASCVVSCTPKTKVYIDRLKSSLDLFYESRRASHLSTARDDLKEEVEAMMSNLSEMEESYGTFIGFNWEPDGDSEDWDD